MKKLLLALFGVLAVATVALYGWVPSVHDIRKQVDFPANALAVNRVLIADTTNQNWWIQSSDTAVTSLPTTDSLTALVRTHRLSSLGVLLQLDGLQAASALHVLPLGKDSVRLEWVAQAAGSYQPLRRWQSWRKAKRMEQALEEKLQAISRFLSQPENIYGVQIREERVTDSILVSTFRKTAGPADQALVYQLVDELRLFIEKNGAKETGYPMVNYTTVDSLHLTRVAIPVDRRLPNAGAISYKWMMGGGKILVAEVKGGPASVEQALKQVENYIRDHQRVPPAIPFFSWVTDRRTYSDSSQWVTRIYYPVM